jgi:hypothetical protein
MPKPEIAGGVEVLDEKARRLLEENLRAGETVEFCLIGRRVKAAQTNDVLAALDERILVVRYGVVARNNPIWGGGTEAVSLYYTDMSGLDLRKTLLEGSIRIDRPGLPLPPQIAVDKSRLDEYRPYINRINEKIHEAKHGSASNAPAGTEFIEELERLADLRNSGALTEEEFRQAKRRMLSVGRETHRTNARRRRL